MELTKSDRNSTELHLPAMNELVTNEAITEAVSILCGPEPLSFSLICLML